MIAVPAQPVLAFLGDRTLDVYKRQDDDRMRGNRVQPTAIGTDSFPTSGRSVSYTHLDVYKRQRL